MAGTGGGFIAVEGVDGAGKGVQSARLRDVMAAAGLDVILTREPGGSPGAEDIRRLIVEGDAARWDDMTELLLIYAARRTHLVETIWPALEAGKWVISDRFADSSRAFQGFAGSLGLERVEDLHAMVVGSFKPDLTLVLDLDPAAALERAAARGGSEDRFEKKGLQYQQRVREGYRRLVQGAPGTHVLVDAGQSVEAVHGAVVDAVNARLGLSLPGVVQL